MIIKVKDKEYTFAGYYSDYKSIPKLAEDCYLQGREDAIEEYKASLIEAYNRTGLRERGIYFDDIIYMMANALIKEKQND